MSLSEHPPHNLEAEQALLGVLLFDNSVAALLDGVVGAEAFHEPFHGRLFAAVLEYAGAGRLADPHTLSQRFASDPAFVELKGTRYLGDLVDKAPPQSVAMDYARVIREAWQRREVIRVAGELMKAARAGGDVSALDLIDQAERELLAIQTSSRSSVLVSASAAVDQVLRELEEPAAAPAIQTGIASLDEELGGIFAGDLILLAGRPSMGKSALASSVALNVARLGRWPDGAPVGVIEINGEMNVSAMMRRHITDRAFDLAPRDAPSYAKLRKRALTPTERAVAYAAAKEVRELETLSMVKRTGLTLSALRSLIRRQAAQWARKGIRLGLVTIDHVGLIRPDRPGFDRYAAQTEVAINMKELADELGIGIVGLVQLSRAIEQRDDKRPILSDLRDSGAWEENADAVVGVYRDAYYAARETEPRKADQRAEWEARKTSKIVEALFLKVREGAAGAVELWGDMPRNAIRATAPETIYGGGAFEWAEIGGEMVARPSQTGHAPDADREQWPDPEFDAGAFA